MERSEDMSKTLKIPCGCTCPNCGESNGFYITKKGRKKGILFGEYFYEGFFDPHYGNTYTCYSCNTEWEERTSGTNLSVRLFPFLKNR